jgi:ABC-type dipeptide/oligopeptide/nickel transport system permease subunit
LEGGGGLLLWGLLLALAVARHDRLLALPSRGLDHWLAALTLVGVLVGLWVWSFQEGSREEGERRGRFWRRFRRNRLAVAGVGLIVLFYLAALLAPLLTPFDPTYQPAFQAGEMELRLAEPSGAHLMGTDQFSRDILSRILYGARISLSIGFLAVGISVTLGTILGAVAGYLGGIVDDLVMRLVDMFMAFPRVVLVIAVVAVFQPSIFLIIAVLALTQWPFTARIVRGEILSLREREFTEAARALGFSRSRIIFRHLLPNAMAPVIVVATLGIGHTIVLEAGLSFLGFGVQPPTPSWGSMVADGRDYLLDAWWIATFPGLAIVTVVLAFNLVGDGLRDALDPRQRGQGGGP